MNKIYILLLLLSVMTIMSCENSSSNNSIQLDLNSAKVLGNVSFFDLFSNAEFIPLESQKECMIYNASRFAVSNNGFVVLDKTNEPKIYEFDRYGNYDRRIGNLGKSKSEYQDCVFDVCTNTSGDSIALLTVYDIKLYDKNGRFLRSNLIEKGYGKDIIFTDNGLVYNSNYSEEYIVHLLNSKLEKEDDLIETQGLAIKSFGISDGALIYSKKHVYLYDEFKSIIYRINTSNHNDIVSLQLQSNNTLKPESFNEQDDIFNHPFDAIFEYYPINDDIVGFLSNRRYFKLDFDAPSMTIYNIDGWMPMSNGEMFDGYLYYIIDQEEFLRIGQQKLLPKSIMSNYEEIRNYINENSNCIIIKLKLK